MGSGYNESLRGQKEVIVTEDGSVTLYSKEFDQAYHSTKDGALRESLQKHVIPAFALQKEKEQLTILDICFGLGYNTLATLYYVKSNHLDTRIHILSPEFDRELVESLATFEYPKEFDTLQPIVRELSENFCYEDEQFRIEVLIGDAREVIPRIQEKIDIVYQDAFSPKQNPLLWTREYFRDIRAICSDDAVITTYSTAIATRMGLHENGFEIFLYCGEDARRSTIASPRMIEGLEYVDMELKKERNREARSLRDADYTAI